MGYNEWPPTAWPRLRGNDNESICGVRAIMLNKVADGAMASTVGVRPTVAGAPDAAPLPAFSAAALTARAPDRLIGLGEPVLERPADFGDHVFNPAIFGDGRPKLRDAAVLVPVVDRGDEATVIFTLRTPHLKSHAGQISLPGGKIDPDDVGPVAAALREAREEIGLSADEIRPIGFGDPYIAGTGYRIVPVVGIVRPEHRIVPNAAEVADVFEVPLSFLMREASFSEGERVLRGLTVRYYSLSYGERTIWGITAGILRALYNRLYG